MFRVPKATMPAPTVLPLNAFAKQSKEHRRCAYSLYECNQPLLDSYSYCSRHILEDTNAPFKQCTFIYNVNGRKCQNPAPKNERKEVSYCAEHTKKAQIVKNKSNTKHSLPESPETLILGLSHYVKPTDPNVKSEDVKKDSGKVLNPFDQIDAYRVNAKGPDILDYASSSDSDVDTSLISDTVIGAYLEDSDNESLHSPEEDPLRHAGVYTAEEVVYIAREKLMRLQSLYIDQFKRLQYTLREKKTKIFAGFKKRKRNVVQYSRSTEGLGEGKENL